MEDSKITIENPAQAEEHYKPLVLDGKLSLDQCKLELEETHNFSKEDVSLTMRIIRKAVDEQKERDPQNVSPISLIVVGLGIVALGVWYLMYCIKTGRITFISYALFAIGILTSWIGIKKIIDKKSGSS